jgi:hypothetical protein
MITHTDNHRAPAVTVEIDIDRTGALAEPPR